MAASSWFALMAGFCRKFPGNLPRGQTPGVLQRVNACRLVSTSSTQFNSSQKRRVSREIKTFDPSKMVEKGQEVFDISGYRFPRFHLSSPISTEKKILFQVHFDSSSKTSALRRPFPAGSIGSLYYYQPAPPLPEIAGGLRFRLMPHVEAFADGKDALCQDGSPWQVHLCNLAKSDCWKPVRLKLLEESLVDPTVLADLKSLDMKMRGGHSYLYYLNQPFELDLSLGSTRKTLINRSMAGQIRWAIINDLYSRVRHTSPRADRWPPYTGRILVRFELQTFPNSRPALVVRVLDVLTPVECLQPAFEFIKRPVPGELLSCTRSTTAIQGEELSDDDYRLISYDLRKRSYGRDVAKFAGITLP